jgi:predicted nucleic acid-binding protein
MRVYIDTSALLAILNPHNRVHLPARELWQALLDTEATLICSNYVLVETLALVQRRMGLEAVQTLVSDILPVLQVEWVDETEHWAGAQLLLIPIARAEFTIAPLLKVPPASRGEPRGARGFGSPCLQGEPEGGGYRAYSFL